MNVSTGRSWLGMIIMFTILAVAGCTGDDGTSGRDGADGVDGVDGVDGQDGQDGAGGGGGASRDLPTLQGHRPMFPEANFHGTAGIAGLDEDRTLPYDVQAAYNGDTFFWKLSYRGNEGKRHQYYRFTNGAWQKEGGDRRDGQSTLDQDEQQGAINVNSTIYEQRTSIMMNDPGDAATDVTDFGEFGCFLTCHNENRNMPEWTEAAGEDTKWIDPAKAPGAVADDAVLDLWHWRGARSNPIGRSDDQHVRAVNFSNTTSGDDGGRHGDAGTGPFKSQNIVGGNPEFVFDPRTTAGKFAFKWDNFWSTPFYYMVQADAEQLGPLAPNPVIIPYADAIAMGYSPTEGDTVPQRVLRASAGSRGDISSFGTTFDPETTDGSYGVWNVQLQRAMNTGNADDVALVAGNVYEAGFEVHLYEYTARDHYVSFPQTISVGPGAADIQAVSFAGTGPEQGPNWAEVPKTRLYLFQPGIATWDFVSGDNEAQAKQYTNAQGQLVGQAHGGSGAVNSGTGCRSCHNVRTIDPAPPLFNAGAMEDLAERRGGIWEATPVVAIP